MQRSSEDLPLVTASPPESTESVHLVKLLGIKTAARKPREPSADTCVPLGREGEQRVVDLAAKCLSYGECKVHLCPGARRPIGHLDPLGKGTELQPGANRPSARRRETVVNFHTSVLGMLWTLPLCECWEPQRREGDGSPQTRRAGGLDLPDFPKPTTPLLLGVGNKSPSTLPAGITSTLLHLQISVWPLPSSASPLHRPGCSPYHRPAHPPRTPVLLAAELAAGDHGKSLALPLTQSSTMRAPSLCYCPAAGPGGNKGALQAGAPYAKSGEGAAGWAPEAWGCWVAGWRQRKSEQAVMGAMRQGPGAGVGGGGWGQAGPRAVRICKCEAWERATPQFSLGSGLPRRASTNRSEGLLASMLKVLELQLALQASPSPWPHPRVNEHLGHFLWCGQIPTPSLAS